MKPLDALLVFPPPYIPTEIQPGMAAILGACNSQGLNVEILDANIKLLEEILTKQDESANESFATLRKYESYKPQNFAIFTQAKDNLAEIAKQIDAKSPETFRLERNTIQFIPRHDAQNRKGILRAITDRHQENGEIFTPHLEKLVDEVPHARVYGIGITDRKQAIPGFILGANLKEKYPNSKIVLGGNFISRARDVFSIDDEINRQIFSHIDFMQYLEGDESFPALVKAIKNGSDIQRIGKLIYNDQGRIVDTGFTSMVNVRKLPLSNYKGLQAWTPRPVIAYNFQRGCLYGKCGFCGIMDGYDGFAKRAKDKPDIFTPRKKHIDEVIDDVKKFVDHGYKFINFTDETFFASDLEKFSKRIIEEKIDIKFTWYARVEDKYLDSEFTQLVSDAGGKFAQFGVESNSINTLNYMKKGTQNLNIKEILQTTHNSGIMNHVFLLIGYPGETVEDSLRLFEFLEDTKDYTFTVKPTWFKLAKGSPDAYRGEGYGFKRTFQEGDLAPNLTYEKTAGMAKKTAQAVNDALDYWIKRYHHINYVAGEYSYSQRLFAGYESILKIADGFRVDPLTKKEGFRPYEPLNNHEKNALNRIWKELVGQEYAQANLKYIRGNHNPQFLNSYNQLRTENKIAKKFPNGFSGYADLLEVL